MPVTISGSGAITGLVIGTTDLADAAVTTPKIADTAVTVAKISATGTPSSGTYLRGDGAWAAIAGFPTSTAMLFVQTAAPTGWTKSTTHDNKALRVVSGSASSGGTTAFTTVFANQTPTITTSGLSAGATTLTTAQMPSHTHLIGSNQAFSSGCGNNYFTGTSGSINSGATGGGGSHTHSISGSATSSAITLNVQYVDVIIATKD